MATSKKLPPPMPKGLEWPEPCITAPHWEWRDWSIINARYFVKRRGAVLDTETTGTGPKDKAVSIAIVDIRGQVLLKTMVNPGIAIPKEATAIHGICECDVRYAPTLEDLRPALARIAANVPLAAYNASFDKKMVPEGVVISHCAMLWWAAYHGEWNSYRRDWAWQKLTNAVAQAGHQMSGKAHDAATDAQATVGLIRYLANQPTAI